MQLHVCTNQRLRRALIETLECRQLLHGDAAFDLHVNFQPAGAVVPLDYVADTGLTFADRGNGFIYGWNLDNTTATRERNSAAALDQRYDTITHTQAYGNRMWEVAVPNGEYTVHLVAGDPSYFGSTIAFNAEGVLVASGAQTSADKFIEGTQTVTVSDGRLTIANAGGASNNKLAFLEVISVDDPSPPPPPPPAGAIKVNFQPGGAAVPGGYFADAGAVFADRGNGFSYGWNLDNAGATRDRNSAASPDQRYDTLTHTQLYGSRAWEIGVPNGQYTVHLVGGDPTNFGSTIKFNAETSLLLSGSQTSVNKWIEATGVVTVADGRLTISNASGASNNKLNFIDITPLDSTTPTVTVTATDNSAAEGGGGGTFTFTRSGGDTSSDLTVKYSITGTALNGTDYQTVGTSLVIPANQLSATININPIDDPAAEPDESVTFNIMADPSYVGSSSDTVTIFDNDSPPTAFSAKINFQPSGAALPPGYVPDAGLAFANGGNGLSYGWSADNSANARDRNNPASPDQRYDTLNHFKSLSWNVAVPNGTYNVHVVVGDPSYTDSVYGLDAEGAKIVGGTPTANQQWFESTTVVSVSDGMLTLTSSSGSQNNRICFVEVDSFNPATPVLSMVPTKTDAAEGAIDIRFFRVKRAGGDTSQPLTFTYTLGGTAINNSDYDFTSTTRTFQSGQTTIDIPVYVINDPDPEQTETVSLTLNAGASYQVGAPSAATIFIADNDSFSTKLTWTTGASSPIARSEAMSATIDGKMYVLGGYTNTTYTPTRRVDVYDPVANTWTRIIDGDMPIGLTHAGCAVLGRTIVIAGGYPEQADGSGQNFSTMAVRAFNVDTHVWTSLPNLPSARGGGALVNLNGTLHFFAGADSARKDAATHWELTPGAAAWTTLASIPTLRNHLGAVVLNNKIYAIGGQQGQDEAEVPQTAVEIYDRTSNTWTTVKPLPIGRSHIAAATFVVNGRIVTIGGEKTFNTTINNVSAYDPVADQWLDMTPLPVSRNSGVGGFVNGEIIYSTGKFATTTYRAAFA